MNTVMSTTIIPDVYRHIARKSTVSRNVKSQPKNVPICPSTFPIDRNSKDEQSIFDTIQCDIKLENDISPQKQTFILIPDNETEQMIVEQTTDEIIHDIFEQIKDQIHIDVSNQIETSIQSRTSISTEIHNAVDSLINHFDEQSIDTTNTESNATTNDAHMEDMTTSVNGEASMESEQQSSILSRSHVDGDDIVEIEASPSNNHPPFCTCQCHQTMPTSQVTNSTNEYLLFEQALRQTREEQQQDRSLNNNRLIQTLKRQHQELMNFYQRQLYINKIDREQQTSQINQHDSQIQTDITTIQRQNTKPPVNQMNGKHSTPNSKGPMPISIRPFNSFLTPIRTTGPSLQQLIPCLTTTTTATTAALTNKTALVKKATLVTATNPQPVPLLAVSQDIVDLTEEDDDDGSTRVSIPIKPQQNPVSTAASTPVTPHIQPVNRSNPTTSLGQTLPLRPLPEHTPCDETIARPQLNITQEDTTVRLTWNLHSTPMESIQNYEIYAYKQNTAVTTSDWKKIGTVKSMRLPMAVTLKEFQSNSHYAFAVRGVSTSNSIGPFCEPKTIFTGSTCVQPANTSQILNVST